MIRLIGPGGAGKSTIGALLAERLDIAFLDLDRHLVGRVGDISEYIGRHGYDDYARENVEASEAGNLLIHFQGLRRARREGSRRKPAS